MTNCTGKDPDARKDWGQEKKGTTEDEMVGWHHQLDGHEFEQAPGVHCSLKGQILKLKLQYFSHLIRRADSFEKTLMLGKTEGERRRG